MPPDSPDPGDEINVEPPNRGNLTAYVVRHGNRYVVGYNQIGEPMPASVNTGLEHVPVNETTVATTVHWLSLGAVLAIAELLDHWKPGAEAPDGAHIKRFLNAHKG